MVTKAKAIAKQTKSTRTRTSRAPVKRAPAGTAKSKYDQPGAPWWKKVLPPS